MGLVGAADFRPAPSTVLQLGMLDRRQTFEALMDQYFRKLWGVPLGAEVSVSPMGLAVLVELPDHRLTLPVSVEHPKWAAAAQVRLGKAHKALIQQRVARVAVD